MPKGTSEPNNCFLSRSPCVRCFRVYLPLQVSKSTAGNASVGCNAASFRVSYSSRHVVAAGLQSQRVIINYYSDSARRECSA